ncbi:flavin reductase family protein [Parafrankia colletiae]|uniref:flavin reductase family protein n=1 Tax=Parafrankia colletiae TaxID=573497 RepID=UPI002AB04046|nr:flavin reductase family protein [Parafrankia colletiae]
MASPARQPLPEPVPVDSDRARSRPADAPGILERPDPDAFRKVVGRFATGVTVLTTVVDGRHLAMTANSFVSVSLEPLLVLVSVRQDARFHDPLLAAGVWGVSVLAADMSQASRDFARRGGAPDPGDRQLRGWAHSLGPRTGVALLDGALALLECGTVATHPAGDHTLVVGEVMGLARPRPDATPLVFYEGAYLSTGPRAGDGS